MNQLHTFYNYSTVILQLFYNYSTIILQLQTSNTQYNTSLEYKQCVKIAKSSNLNLKIIAVMQSLFIALFTYLLLSHNYIHCNLIK
jgi:hypothetical protein